MRVLEVVGLKWSAVDVLRDCVVVVERYYSGDTDLPKSEHSNRYLPLGILADAYRLFKQTKPGAMITPLRTAANPSTTA
jgi:hypothetical protein